MDSGTYSGSGSTVSNYAQPVISTPIRSGYSGSVPYQTVKTTSARGQLQIIDYHTETEGSEYFKVLYIVGTAKNVGGKKLSYGSVEAKFYDSNGNLLNNGLDNFNNLEPGETWKFKIVYLGSDVGEVSRFDIAVGSSW